MTLDERQAEIKERAREQRERADLLLREQMSTPMGRELVCWLVYDLCGFRAPVLNVDPTLTMLAQARAMVGGTLARRAAFVDREGWAALEHERINRELAVQPLPPAEDTEAD